MALLKELQVEKESIKGVDDLMYFLDIFDWDGVKMMSMDYKVRPVNNFDNPIYAGFDFHFDQKSTPYWDLLFWENLNASCTRAQQQGKLKGNCNGFELSEINISITLTTDEFFSITFRQAANFYESKIIFNKTLTKSATLEYVYSGNIRRLPWSAKELNWVLNAFILNASRRINTSKENQNEK